MDHVYIQFGLECPHRLLSLAAVPHMLQAVFDPALQILMQLQHIAWKNQRWQKSLCFRLTWKKATPPLSTTCVMVSKLKLKPAECHRAVQCSLPHMLCSAYVGRIGLLGFNVLFSMCQSGCVCVCVCVCVCHEAMYPVFKVTSRNTNQQSITNVIDRLWHTTTG